MILSVQKSYKIFSWCIPPKISLDISYKILHIWYSLFSIVSYSLLNSSWGFLHDITQHLLHYMIWHSLHCIIWRFLHYIFWHFSHSFIRHFQQDMVWYLLHIIWYFLHDIIWYFLQWQYLIVEYVLLYIGGAGPGAGRVLHVVEHDPLGPQLPHHQHAVLHTIRLQHLLLKVDVRALGRWYPLLTIQLGLLTGLGL